MALTPWFARRLVLAGVLFMGCLVHPIAHAGDQRELVAMPDMMRNHMLANMRDHLVAINEILVFLSTGELDKASDVAEQRLGMSALGGHGASHMAKVMPQRMREIGTSMHRAASRFALRAEEGDAKAALMALPEVTSACVACHAGYRVQ